MADPGSSFNSFGNGSRYELKKAMNKLELFMKVEKALLQRKHNPGHKIFHEDPAAAEAMLEFINLHSDLGKTPFWTNLSREKQIDAFEFMSSRDISPHTIISIASRKKADIFIVLSGTGTQINKTTQEEKELKMGCVFGAVEVFDRYQDETYAESEGGPVEYLATMPRGNLIRLRYSDFIISQFGVSENAEHAFLMRASPAERLVFEAKKCALDVFPPEAVETLEGSSLMPQGVDDAAFNYLFRGHVNRKIEVHRGEAPSVYCLLSGSVNVLIKSHRATALNLKHHNAGLSTMKIRVSGAPVLQVHKGAVFYIDDGVFDIDTNTDEPLSKRLDKVAQKHSHVKHFLERSHSMTLKSKPSPSAAGAGAALTPKTVGSGKPAVGASVLATSQQEDASVETGPAFHLELAFASDCLYLRLPKTEFLEAMREPTPPSIGMLRRAREQSQILAKKIASFDIWTSGHVEISLQHQHRFAMDFLEGEVPNPPTDVFDTSHHVTRQVTRPKLVGAVSFHVQAEAQGAEGADAGSSDGEPFPGEPSCDAEEDVGRLAVSEMALTDKILPESPLGGCGSVAIDGSAVMVTDGVADAV